MNKIVFLHSLNNYTGSPNILSIVIKGLIQCGYKAEIITSHGNGFLSNIKGASYRYTCYQWCKSQATTLFLLILSQTEMFFHCLFGSRKHLYYINSIIPFGAFIACWITRKRYVIHIHEDIQQNKTLYRVLKQIYRVCNKKSIFVSEYVMQQALYYRNGVVIANALPDEFFEITNQNERKRKNILMISSLRRFKGIYEFVTLAKMLPEYSFELVLSATDNEVKSFQSEIGVVPNLTVYSFQTDVHFFYQRSLLLLQLSHPNNWIETFGLTILEAMAYGIPVIAPNIGGPVELVENGVNGYTVDPLDVLTISNQIKTLMRDKSLYQQLSANAKRKSTDYTEKKMITEIERYIK